MRTSSTCTANPRPSLACRLKEATPTTLLPRNTGPPEFPGLRAYNLHPPSSSSSRRTALTTPEVNENSSPRGCPIIIRGAPTGTSPFAPSNDAAGIHCNYFGGHFLSRAEKPAAQRRSRDRRDRAAPAPPACPLALRFCARNGEGPVGHKHPVTTLR